MVTSPYTHALAKYISMHEAKVEPAVAFDEIFRRFSNHLVLVCNFGDYYQFIEKWFAHESALMLADNFIFKFHQ